MKIYQIKRKTYGTCNYAELKLSEKSPWEKELLFLNQYKIIHNLPIEYEVTNQIKPYDFPVADSIVFSKLLLDIIKKNTKNIEFFDSKIIYSGKNKTNYIKQTGKMDGQIWDTFYTMIFPEVELFNWIKSKYVKKINKLNGKEIVTQLEQLVLDKNKIDKNLDFIMEQNMFVLSEQQDCLLCTGQIKQAIEEAELTGIAFEEVPVE